MIGVRRLIPSLYVDTNGDRLHEFNISLLNRDLVYS